ncbi:hypothetical protein TNCV_3925731 [Trichonephila clavipes]|nr:hypothetical protein TNCV_3925731 [Trichonephila clavipes]
MEIPLRTAYSQAGRCGMQPKAKHSLRAQAHQSKSRTETVKTETLEKKLRIREREKENARENEYRTTSFRLEKPLSASPQRKQSPSDIIIPPPRGGPQKRSNGIKDIR